MKRVGRSPSRSSSATNLIDTEPVKAAALQARLDAHQEELGPRPWPVLIEAPIPVDRTSREPFVLGEEFVYWPN